jgi:hypothetical protein
MPPDRIKMFVDGLAQHILPPPKTPPSCRRKGIGAHGFRLRKVRATSRKILCGLAGGR